MKTPLSFDVMPQVYIVADLRTPMALATAIRSRLPARGHLVGVDGFMESGKTTLAFELAELLGGIRIGLDSYLHTDRNGESYVGALRQSYLISHLTKLKAVLPYVVVDGICLSEAFEIVGHRADSHIYVKRISKAGIWHDGILLEDAEDGEPLPDDWLRRNELSYHLSSRPHEVAHFMYERIEA